MNLRILKKLSKRAMPLLVALGDTWPEQFLSSGDGDVSISVERKHMHRIRCRHPWNELLRVRAKSAGDPWIAFMWPGDAWSGTPMVGGRFGYEEPEWEERTAWEHLVDHVATASITWTEDGPGWGPRLPNARAVLQAAEHMAAAVSGRHQ